MTTKRILGEERASTFFNWAYQQGWTDGLPVLPPTVEDVAAMMAAVDLPPSHLVARLGPKNGDATVERIAANAVMAGCLPDYLPVVIAAVEAVAGQADGMNTTTNPSSPMLVINGPIRNEIGMNCSWSCLGPGNRANATIGRALSLIMINIAGRIPGEVCKATQAMPGRYTFCFGEYEEKNPWEPLHVEKGFKREDNTLTVLGATGTINVVDPESLTADEILHTVAHSMMVIGSNNIFPSYGTGSIGVIFCPDHAEIIGAAYTKRQVKEYLLETTSKIPIGWQTERRLKTIASQNRGQIRSQYLRLMDSIEQLLFVVAGGLGGLHSVVVHSIGSAAATVLIKYRKR